MKILLLLLLFCTDTNAVIRSQTVIYNFKKNYPCPTDFIRDGKCWARVDHICALQDNGVDSTPNLQWQRYDLSLLKDKEEGTIVGKQKYCNNKNSTLNRQVF